MSDKYEQAANDIIAITSDLGSGDEAMEDVSAYLREQFPEPQKIEGVRELVAQVGRVFETALNQKMHKTMYVHQALNKSERLITDFIQQREAGKYACQKDCIAYNTEIGCNTCVRKVNDNYISIKDGIHE